MIGDDESHEFDDVGPTDETASAVDPQANTRRKQRKKLAEDNAGDFWRRVMADPTGRAEMFKLMQSCGLFQNRHAVTPTGFPNPDETWFYLGQKSIGEILRETLELADRVSVFKMFDENHPRFMKPAPTPRKKRTDGE